MAIIVEDGTIVENANSYISVLEADAYHIVRGRELTWADLDDDEEKEPALIRATQALENYYRQKWVGIKTNNNTAVVPAQLLAWPRRERKDSNDPIVTADDIEIGINSIPQQVKFAAAEAAFIELTTSIIPGVVGQDKFLILDKIGPLEQEWDKGRPTVDLFPILDSMLIGLASPAAGGVTVVIGLTEQEINQTSSNPFLNPDYFNVII